MTHKRIRLSVAIFALFGMVAFGTAQSYAQTVDAERTDMSEQQQQAVSDRKAAMQQKLADKKAERTTKLEAKRLEVCEKRQSRINEIISRGTERNTKQLGVFQAIEDKVVKFYEDKNLSSDGYTAALADADAKEAVAVAAIEVSTETTFDCATADGEKPGAVIKQAMVTRHQALKDYRTAIKELIVVVKKALGTRDSSTSTPSNETGDQQ